MSELVKRLRSNAMPGSLMDEAADRIEALEAALREIATKFLYDNHYRDIAKAALAPEQDK